jgi:hypothetical protein
MDTQVPEYSCFLGGSTMKTKRSYRSLILSLLISSFIIALAAPVAQAQSKEQSMSVQEFKQMLRESDPPRNLSQATHEELQMLKEGGSLTETVLKIGISTFVMNMLWIWLIILLSAFTIFMFFTPIGLALFRGNLHAFVGALLKATGISTKFGEHLIKEPKKWLQREKSVRQAFALYMHNEFIPEYKNNITAIAFIGTAFLILNIGLRGVKFMVAHQPDMIVIAILVEITVLCLLGLTTWYEKEEEEDGEGVGAGITGKQLSLRQVNEKLDALKNELESSVDSEMGLRQ